MDKEKLKEIKILNKKLTVFTCTGVSSTDSIMSNDGMESKDNIVIIFPEYKYDIKSKMQIAINAWNEACNSGKNVVIYTCDSDILWGISSLISLNHCKESFKSEMEEKFNLGYIGKLTLDDIISYTINDKEKTIVQNRIDSNGIHIESWEKTVEDWCSMNNSIQWSDSGFVYPPDIEDENKTIYDELFEGLRTYLHEANIDMSNIRQVGTIQALVEALEFRFNLGNEEDKGNCKWKSLKSDAYIVNTIFDAFINGEYEIYNNEEMVSFWNDYLEENMVKE